MMAVAVRACEHDERRVHRQSRSGARRCNPLRLSYLAELAGATAGPYVTRRRCHSNVGRVNWADSATGLLFGRISACDTSPAPCDRPNDIRP